MRLIYQLPNNVREKLYAVAKELQTKDPEFSMLNPWSNVAMFLLWLVREVVKLRAAGSR